MGREFLLIIENPLIWIPAALALLYLVMSYPLSLITRRLEKRFGNPVTA